LVEATVLLLVVVVVLVIALWVGLRNIYEEIYLTPSKPK